MNITISIFKFKISLSLLDSNSLIFYWLNVKIHSWDLVNIYHTNNFKAGAIKVFNYKLISWLKSKIKLGDSK